jgi:hypothetical protein
LKENNPDEDMNISLMDVLSLRKEARMLYYNIQQNIIHHIKAYEYPGDLIRILHEIAHKRALRDILFDDGLM